MYLNIRKAICDKSTANIIIKGEKLKGSSLWSNIRHGCPFSLLLFNRVLQELIRAIKPAKEIKGIQIENEEATLSLFAGNMILKIENPKNLWKQFWN